MLFDNFLADKEDRFYFVFAFAVRAWLSFLFFTFGPFLPIHFSYSLGLNQFLVVAASYVLMGLLDFSHTYTKLLKEIKRKRWVEIQHNGLKCYR